jgi:hypothetical protein
VPIRRIQTQLETLADPVLDTDELGLDPATKELRVGDGATAWTGLPAAGSATYTRIFTPEAKGTCPADGSVDVSAYVLGALADLYAAGGGTLALNPAKKYRMDSALTMPDDGTGISGLAITGAPKGVPIRIDGGGMFADGINAGVSRTGGAVLDLRYNGGGPGKIDTRYNGFLEITGCTITNLGAADTKPILYGTNTVVWVHHNAFLGHTSKSGTACNQDALVFGGVDTKTVGPGVNEIFAGYGSVVEQNFFDRLRRIVWGRASFNSNMIRDNLVGKNCGATTSESAITLDGGTVGAVYIQSGNKVDGNTFEIGGYVRPIRVRNSNRNQFIGNGYYDYQAGLAYVYTFEGTANQTADTQIIDAYYEATILTANKLVDTSGATGGSCAPLLIYGRLVRNAILDSGTDAISPVTIQPTAAQAGETSTVFWALRSAAESTNPGGTILQLQNSGTLKIPRDGTAIYLGAGDRFAIGSDASLVRTNAGNIDVYSGPTAADADAFRIMRGVFRNRALATASRPSASAVGAGGQYYDTTLNKPVYSDGTNWRDAAGTIV